MDTYRGNYLDIAASDDWLEVELDEEVTPREPPPSPVGQDERRMQVRAYNFWAGLLGERSFPSVSELDPHGMPDFGPYSVLLDFSDGIENPGVRYLGQQLAEECGSDGRIETLADVPARSLLSRITDHYMQILANQAPIGFEAEFINQAGRTILYRGILLPFSSNDETIDFIYGVINWKELADQATTDELILEIDQALEANRQTMPVYAQPVYADPVELAEEEPEEEDVLDLGIAAELVDEEPAEQPAFIPASPARTSFTELFARAQPDDEDDEAVPALDLQAFLRPADGMVPFRFRPFDSEPDPTPVAKPAPVSEQEQEPEPDHGIALAAALAALDETDMGLGDWLASAREMAEAARGSEDRTRGALYAAIGKAYDFSLAAAEAPEEFAELVAESGLTMQDRAPMTPVVKLVFGADYDKTRLTEYATALTHAQRIGLPRGKLASYLSSAPGGLKAVVSEERRLKREESGKEIAARDCPREALARKLRKLDHAPLDAVSSEGSEFTLLVARRLPSGEVVLLGEVADDIPLLEKAAKKLLG